jgi:PKD repeat protein
MIRYFLLKQVLVFLFILTAINLWSQTFTDSGISLPGVYDGSCAWGDYDNDGDLDVLLTGGLSLGSAAAVSKIYENDGNNSFTEQINIVLTGVIGSVGWGDYDNDGDLDILLTGYNSSNMPVTKIYQNNGDKTFTEQTGFNLAQISNSSVAWGDYDNDGDLDILLAGTSYSGYISKIYSNNRDNSFSEQTGVVLPGVYRGSLVWGDYNNDDYLDILLTGASHSGYISKIYRNNGNNSFTVQNNIILQGIAERPSVAWGDYDNDSDLDILLTGWGFSKLYRNNGNNSFTEQITILLTKVRNSSVAWGDYDNDGDLDILLTGATGLSSNYDPINPISKIYRNNGDNSFTEQTGITLPEVYYSSVAWGDYDNDGDLDILLTGMDNIGNLICKIYRNGILNPNIKPSTPTGLQSIWDDDNLILKWNKSSDNSTPLNAIEYNLRIGTAPGGNDIKSAQALSNGKLLLTNISNLIRDTCISLKLPFNKYYWSVQAVDRGGLSGSFAIGQITPLDSIQATDLKAVIKSSSSLLIRWEKGNGLRRILFGRLSSTSSAAKPINGVIYHAEPYFGHGDKIGITDWYCMYNGEADSAIIFGTNEGYSYDIQVIEYIEINGLPHYFTTKGTGNPGVFSTSIFSEQKGISLVEIDNGFAAWGDYDKDGYLDIILTGTSSSGTICKIYRNNGNNSFTEQAGIVLTGVYLSSVVWGDYNNDCYLDILLTGSNGSSSFSKIYLNNGNNTFTEQTDIVLTGVFYSSTAWGDYDNDGDLDILLTGADGSYSSYNSISKIYRNNGNNTFIEQSDIILTGVSKSSVAWGDYDSDGNLDILLTGATGVSPNYNPVSKIYRNNGNNSFTEQTGIVLKGVYMGSVAWGDYDNDGDLDVVMTGETGNGSNLNPVSKIYRNNNNGFTEITNIILPGVRYSSVALGDCDNDGDLDIILAGIGQSYTLKIFLNNGNDSFTEQTGISLTGVYNGSVVWGDYDNDGDLDFLSTGRASGAGPTSKVYSNNLFMKAGTYSANRKPVPPRNLLSSSQPDGMKLYWSPIKTDETYYKAMTYNVRIGRALGESDKLSAHSDFINGDRRIVTMGNTQLDTSFFIKNIPYGKYYWSVQAVDQGYTGGSWSTVDSFEVRNVQAFYSYDEICLGYPTHFTDQSVATDSIASWKWDFKDGTTSSIQSPVHTYSTSGIYNVKLVITSTAGDKDSLEQNVIVKPRPSVSFTAPNVCEGTSTTISNTTSVNGLTIGNWLWDFGDGQISAVQQPGNHTYSLKGTYLTKLKAIATNGCADSITKEVIVAAIPNAAISVNGKTTFCHGDSVQLIVENNPLYSYQWKLDNNDLINTDTSSYKVKLNSGPYSVKVTNTLANCIATSSQTNVTVNPIPLAPYISASGSTQFCQGDSVVLSVTNTIGYTYQWKQNGGAVGSNRNSFTAKSSGGYTLTVFNSSGCSANSTNTVNVVVNPKPTIPTVAVNGSKSFCQGGSVDLSVSNNTDYTYQWQDNGSDISNATSNTFTAKNSGVYSLNIVNSDGCSGKTGNVTINVLASPDAPSISSSGALQFCQGDSIVLSVTNTAGYTNQWKQNGGAVGSNSNNIVAKSSGSYNLIVSNANGCSVSSVNSIDVIVNPSPAAGNISLSGPATFCQGGSVILSVPSTTGYTYNWRNENGVISNASTNNYTATISGKYQLDITNSSECTVKTSPVNVVVKSSPYKPVIESINYEAGKCPGDNIIRLNATQAVAEYQYQWYKDGLPLINKTLSTLELFEQGNYKLEANLNGCKAESDVFNINFPGAPEKPMIYAQGPTVWYLACSNTKASKYKWYCNDKLIEGADKYYYVANRKMGDYQVSIANELGCYTRSDIVTIPTGATGINDIDPFEGLKIYPNPTTGMFTIEMDNDLFGELLITIITEQGKEIRSIKSEKTTEHFFTQIDLSGQSKGLYFLNLTIENYFATRKVVVE